MEIAWLQFQFLISESSESAFMFLYTVGGALQALETGRMDRLRV